jgi:hypothetical protein
MTCFKSTAWAVAFHFPGLDLCKLLCNFQTNVMSTALSTASCHFHSKFTTPVLLF